MKDRFVQQVAVFNVIVAPCDAVPGQVATAVFERWDKGIHTNPTRHEYALTNERAMRLAKAVHQVRVPGRFRPFLALGFGWVWEREQARESAVKTYEVQVRGVKERHVVQAASAQEACAKCGWMIGECYVREVRK